MTVAKANEQVRQEANPQGQATEVEEPFYLVLVDIEKAAFKNEISCVKVLFEDDPSYLCISYRWGELNEMIATTPEYHAHVRSFDLDDFCNLCMMMLNEPDLKAFRYVWVDAISINQSDEKQKKATIYRMSEIYQKCQYIVAVPDLHYAHLLYTYRSVNVFPIVKMYQEYLYHLLQGNVQEIIRLDQAWMDYLCIDEDSQVRRHVTGNTNLVIDGMLPLDMDDPSLYQHLTDALVQSFDRNIRGSDGRSPYLPPYPSEFSTHPYDFVRYPKVPNMQQQQHQKQEIPANALSMTRLLNGLKYDEWKRWVAQRYNDIRLSVEFLASVIDDWSSRVWVISEIQIARTKNHQKMKYWFVSLNNSALCGLPFLEFDFQSVKPMQYKDDDLLSKPLTLKLGMLGINFHVLMHQRLEQLGFLARMLVSKASRHEDRFHAVFPSSEKYRKCIANKKTVSDWHIDDMVGVRLKLLELCDIEDQTILLEACSHQIRVPILPSFATFQQNEMSLQHMFPLQTDIQCNFDKQDCIRLVTSHQQQQQSPQRRAQLLLRPRQYFMYMNRYETADQHVYDNFNDPDGMLRQVWKNLGLDHLNEKPTVVSLPIFVFTEDNSFYWGTSSEPMRDIQLVGHMEKNVWVVYQSQYIARTNTAYEPDQWAENPVASYLQGDGFHIY